MRPVWGGDCRERLLKEEGTVCAKDRKQLTRETVSYWFGCSFSLRYSEYSCPTLGGDSSQ